jgi:hypothetical protein
MNQSSAGGQIGDAALQLSYPARRLAEIFSLLTGLSFVVSVLTQEAIFAFWGLDFTAIASIEDVIMGGLRLLLLAFLLFVFFGTVFTRVHIDRQVKCRPKRWSASWIVRITSTIVLGAATSSSIIYFSAFYPHEMIHAGAFRLFGLIAFIWLISSSAIWFMTGSQSIIEVVTVARQGSTRILWATFFGTIMISFQISAFTAYYNVEVTNVSVLPPRCSIHEILWIGTRAMVLRCGRASYVLLHGDKVVTLRII